MGRVERKDAREEAMSRVEVNLWDAERLAMDGDSLIIDTRGARYEFKLPVEASLPKFVWQRGVCGHSPFMHKLTGGCTASGCDCPLSRHEDHIEEEPEYNQRDEDERVYQHELDKQMTAYRQERE